MRLKSLRPKSQLQLSPRQTGFALVAAMFVMIIIAMVVLAMMRLAGNQHGTNSLAIQQARAYQAARAGLDWGITQAAPPVGAPSCVANAAVNLAGSNLSEFTLAVTCSPSAYSENGVTVNVYRLTATAQNGQPGSRPDYAFRALNAAVQSAVP